ncbi:MAG: signal peptidase I [Treponema sp.]|nr:signal peptidase I [Treponema sp.]
MAMFDKSLKYSYLAQKRERHKLLQLVLIFIVLFLLYNTFCAFVLSVWVLDNNSMQPGLQPGDRFFILSSTLPQLFSSLGEPEDRVPFGRGSLVLLNREKAEDRNWFLTALDTVVRFFTAQQLSVFRKNEQIYLKRLVALPGDEVSMVNFEIKVRPAGSSYLLTEFEFSDRTYNINIPFVPAIWNDSLPLSGNMDVITLKPGECFVISDDRLNSSDSRTWGPVRVNEIIGSPIFRFWPPGRIGRPNSSAE